jgi:CRISPR-associated endonuclease/helicase Cas3
MDRVLAFWGKTALPATCGATEGGAPAYKPVLHHLLDVAAVAHQFLLRNSARTHREATLAGMKPEAYASLMAFFAGLHDLGKISRSFQHKAPDLWPKAVLGSRPVTPPAGANHWEMTGLLLRSSEVGRRFQAYAPNVAEGFEWSLVAAIAGHHGAPPSAPGRFTSVDDPVCLSVAAETFGLIEELLRPVPAEHLDEDGAARLSWRLSGLTILADWVGSDARFFPLAPIHTPIADYWSDSLKAADEALSAKGLLPVRAANRVRLTDIAPNAATSPRPMQAIAESLALAGGRSFV